MEAIRFQDLSEKSTDYARRWYPRKDFSCASERLRSDYDVVMAAVSAWPGALKYASDRLKLDKEICLAAIREHAASVNYCRCLTREFTLECIKANPETFKHVSSTWGHDPEFMADALKANPRSLSYFYNRHRSSVKFWRLALEQDGSLIKDWSFPHPRTPELIKVASKTFPEAVNYTTHLYTFGAK